MKRKTINKILRNKFDEYIKHLEEETVDKELINLVKNNTIITGGCIASMLLNEDVNDYDFYFRNKETAKKVAEYYVEQYQRINNNNKISEILVKEVEGRIKIYIRSAGIAVEDNSDYQYFELESPEKAEEYIEKSFDRLKYFPKKKYEPFILSDNAVSLTGDIQLIIRFFGEPGEVHKNFDFAHTKNYWTSWNRQVILNSNAIEHILTKTLKYEGSLYPVASLFRLRKFIRRGWTITAGEIFKIAHQISEMDLSNMDVLEDQLMGVDAAYFQELLQILRRVNPKEVNKTYLFQLLDKVFEEVGEEYDA